MEKKLVIYQKVKFVDGLLVKVVRIVKLRDKNMRLEVVKPHMNISWVNTWVELEAFENPNDQNALQINIVLSDEQGRSIWHELNKKYAKKG